MTATAEPLTIESLGALLTAQQAREIFRQGEEAAVFALLELAKQLRQAQGTSTSRPSTPSGMKPPYQKPTTKQRRGKSGGPGRKAGHTGSRRQTPEHIDQTKEHRLECSPDCGGELTRCNQTRMRYTETFRKTLRRSLPRM